jgi:hypothetical protein
MPDRLQLGYDKDHAKTCVREESEREESEREESEREESERESKTVRLG